MPSPYCQSPPAQQAAPPAAPAARAAEITLPFTPPLDTDLRYRVTTQRVRGGKPVELVVIQTLRFRRADTGYVLRIATLSFASGGITFTVDDPRVPLLIRLLAPPVEFDLDDSGGPLRVRDWPGTKARLVAATAAMNDMVPAGSPDRAAADRVSTSVLQHFTRMTAEQATGQWLQSWNALLGIGGMTMEDGKTISTPSEFDMGVGTPVPTNITATMRSGPNHTATLSSETRIDDARLGETSARLVQQLVGNAATDPAARARIEEAVSALKGATLDDRVDATFDRTTGIPLSANIRRTLSTPNGPSVTNSTRIERAD